jgi:hypothetical protein
VDFAQSYKGVVTLMASAHTNPDSALYASCAAIHSASARLLLRAQATGAARADMNGDDLFALMTLGARESRTTETQATGFLPAANTYSSRLRPSSVCKLVNALPDPVCPANLPVPKAIQRVRHR